MTKSRLFRVAPRNRLSLYRFLFRSLLEAILVTFGRRALIFLLLFESSWKNMKNDTTLCAWTVVITLETKNVEKRHLTPSNLTFLTNCDRRKGFSQNKRRRADLQNGTSAFFNFCPQDLLMLFQSLPIILPRFFDFERP